MADPTLDPSTGREAIPADMAADWKAMHPDGTVQQMNQDYFAFKAGQIKPAESANTGGSTLGNLWNKGRDFANANVAGVLQHGLTGQPPQPGDPTAGHMPGGLFGPEGAAQAAKIIVPQTPAAAMVAAIPGVGPLAKMGFAARTGLSAAAGAGANAATGNDPLMGGVIGAAGQVIPAAAGLIGKGVSKGVEAYQKYVAPSKIQEAVDIPWAQRFMDWMKTAAPSLHSAADAVSGTAPQKVAAIQESKVFDPAVRGIMDTIENKIKNTVSTVPHPTETIDPWTGLAPDLQQLFRNQGRLPPPPVPVEVPVDEALKNWHTLMGQARAASGNPSAAHDLYEQATAWENAVTNAIPKALTGAWNKARSEFGQALRFQELGQKAAQSAEATAQGTPFNPAGVVNHIFANPKRYVSMPGIKDFFPKGQVGVQPTVYEAGGYGHIPGLRMGGGHVPLGTYVTQPGQSYGAPQVADKLKQAAQAGVYGLGNAIQPGQ